MNHILALDQGTTSSRAIVFDREETAKGMDQRRTDILTAQLGGARNKRSALSFYPGINWLYDR